MATTPTLNQPTNGAPSSNPGFNPRAKPLLEVKNLRKFFPIRKGFLRTIVGHVRAVDDVSFDIRKGETLSLVGESGCGKTTTSRCILRALNPTSGEINFHSDDKQILNVAKLSKGELRPLRRQMQMIFQDPYSSLNPRMTILDIVSEPLLVNGMRNSEERRERVKQLLELVQLPQQYSKSLSPCLQRWTTPAHRHRPRTGPQPCPDCGR